MIVNHLGLVLVALANLHLHHSQQHGQCNYKSLYTYNVNTKQFPCKLR